MKKKGILVVSIFLVLPILLMWLTGCAPVENPRLPPKANEASEPSEPYHMEQLSPDIIRVVGLTTDGENGVRGYGKAFAMAIKDIGKRYYILETTPIDYSNWGRASLTKELIIKVSPK